MRRFAVTVLLIAASMGSAAAHACSTCFGAAGDPQTEGRNAAILTLLITTYTLFTGMIAAAFILWRRGRKAVAAAAAAEPGPDHE
jgi:hypothetical protein